jgi:hypothetical protein
MAAITPADFFSVYVLPALNLYRDNRLTKHLAVNALSQMDNLAEVVAAYTLAPEYEALRSRNPGKYRGDLRLRFPELGTIQDAHDCHKHGKLNRASASEPRGIVEGRPERAIKRAFICGVTRLGGDLTPYETLSVTVNDGTEYEVLYLLIGGLQAWEAEFQRLGLSSLAGRP